MRNAITAFSIFEKSKFGLRKYKATNSSLMQDIT